MQEILNERARPRQTAPERTATPPTPHARLQPDADEDEEASLAQQLTVHIPDLSLASVHPATCSFSARICLCCSQQLTERLDWNLSAKKGPRASVSVSNLEDEHGKNRTWRWPASVKRMLSHLCRYCQPLSHQVGGHRHASYGMMASGSRRSLAMQVGQPALVLHDMQGLHHQCHAVCRAMCKYHSQPCSQCDVSIGRLWSALQPTSPQSTCVLRIAVQQQSPSPLSAFVKDAT